MSYHLRLQLWLPSFLLIWTNILHTDILRLRLVHIEFMYTNTKVSKSNLAKNLFLLFLLLLLLLLLLLQFLLLLLLHLHLLQFLFLLL